MNAQAQLADLVGECYTDLRKFMKMAYPWGEKDGPLENFDGPENWCEALADDISEQVVLHKFDGHHPVPVIYVAVASGNGCAKSTFASMVTNWIMSTRPFCQGTVTANTGAQLGTKTWTQIEWWTKMCITSDWFEVQSESVRHKIHKSKWATNALTWSAKNPQAFAGQHARQSTSFYIFDEASHIVEAIFLQSDGGLTDGEPMVFLFGNPGKRGGRLYRAVFGDLQGRYIHKTIDSRTCKYTNKDSIKMLVDERGEDSDWVRAHVKGLAPNASDLQFIDNERVENAMKRPLPPSDQNEPLIMAVDFARGGSNWNRISYRRGRDMRSIPSQGIPGEKTRDTQVMISIILENIRDKQPDVMFGDATGVGGPIMDGVRALVKHIPIIDVGFGQKAPLDELHYKDWRSYMWAMHKEWLMGGCIENDEKLKEQLTAPEFWHVKDKLQIESKESMEERNIPSPDWADSEILTHAMPVPPKKVRQDIRAQQQQQRYSQRNNTGSDNSPKRGWMRS